MSQRKKVVMSKRPRKSTINSATTKQVSLLGQAIRSLGGLAGGALGGVVGAPVTGASAGTHLGAALSKWMGAGDYEVSRNSIVSGSRSSPNVPMMHSSNQTVTVRHKDYLGPVKSSIDYAVQYSLPLNPGLSETFPWLSGIARRFQEYSFKGVVFHFVPTSGSISTTQALGSVMMQTTYRASDSAPASKSELLNEYWACESVPFEPLAHPIECDPKENPFNIQYTRTTAIPNEDSRLIYDLGTTHVATNGQSTNGVVLGDLWVTYEVELKKPILNSNTTISSSTNGTAWTGAALTSTAFFNGTEASRDGSLKITYKNRSITFPRGKKAVYYVSVQFGSNTGFSGGVVFNDVSTFTNCGLWAYHTKPQTGLQVFGPTATASTALTAASYNIAVIVTNPDFESTLTLPAMTITGGVIDYISARVVQLEHADI